MKKWNKKLFYITSFVIFIPMIAGFLLWNRLPDRLITHWNAMGEPDGSMDKLAAILSLPIFIFAMHLFCLFMVHLDARNKNQSPKALAIAYWAMPITSLFGGAMMLGNAVLEQLHLLNYLNVLLGILFIIVGNYMPKCQPNGSLGIRLPWTLADEENWRKTHRFSGPVWMIGGVLLMLGAFLPEKVQMPILTGALLLVLIVTGVYSYRLSKKDQAAK